MKYEPPHDRYPDPTNRAPLGRSPDEHWITSVDELPVLPIPKRVEVTNDFVEIDGWVFPFSHISKSLLIWIYRTCQRWLKEDESEGNRQWVNGILNRLQAGVAGEL